MSEDKAEYTAGGKVTPDNAGAAMQLITENYIAQLERTIDGYAMIQGRHADTITEQKRRIAELEQTVARLEQDNKRLRNLDAMPVDALDRIMYDVSGDLLEEWTQVREWLNSLDGAA